MELIPWNNLPHWGMEIELSGIPYHLEFRWNALNQYWSMNIYDLNQEPLILGIKVVKDYNITRDYTVAGLFPGSLLVVDLSQDVNAIGRLDMGNRVQLVYLEPEDEI